MRATDLGVSSSLKSQAYELQAPVRKDIHNAPDVLYERTPTRQTGCSQGLRSPWGQEIDGSAHHQMQLACSLPTAVGAATETRRTDRGGGHWSWTTYFSPFSEEASPFALAVT